MNRVFLIMAALFVLLFFVRVAGVVFLLMAFFKIAFYIKEYGFALPTLWTIVEWSLMINIGLLLIGIKVSMKR